MSVQCGTSDLNILLETIEQSYLIRKHLDFYQWQQDYVCQLIPHDVLIAAWGDFSDGQLHFDVSSNVPEINTQKLLNDSDEIYPLLSDLFCNWECNGDRWFYLEEFRISKMLQSYTASDRLITRLKKMKSLLVYGFRDKRTDQNIIYAFFNSSNKTETHTNYLGMLMPHLDSALRGIDCLTQPRDEEHLIRSKLIELISVRELEVLKLVVEGKTNLEIAGKLYISLNTVKNHLKSIFRKLEVSSRAEAVAKYLVAETGQASSYYFTEKHNCSEISMTMELN